MLHLSGAAAHGAGRCAHAGRLPASHTTFTSPAPSSCGARSSALPYVSRSVRRAGRTARHRHLARTVLRIADTGNTGKLSQTEVAAALASQYPLDEAKLRAMLADRRIRDDSAGSPGRGGGDGDGPSRAARQRSRGAGDSGGSGGSSSRQRPSALW